VIWYCSIQYVRTLPSCIPSNLTFCRNFVFETLQSKEQTLQHKEQTLQNKEQTLQNKEQLLQNEEQFVSSFVRTSREHYACLFSAHDSALKSTEASVDHTVQGFVREVRNLN